MHEQAQEQPQAQGQAPEQEQEQVERSTNFDYCADGYEAVYELPLFKFGDLPTILSLLPDLHGRSLLDLGCGDGYLTRILQRQGATRVVGVDLSQDMIDIARAREVAQPQGIEYVCEDVYRLHLAETFDVVVLSLLLSLAHTRENLVAMLRCVFEHQHSGSRLVLFDENLFASPQEYPRAAPYGYLKSARGKETLEEGDPVDVTVRAHGIPDILITETYLPREAWLEAFAQVGFVEVQWHRPLVAPEALAQMGTEFWQDYVDLPVSLFVTARKP